MYTLSEELLRLILKGAESRLIPIIIASYSPNMTISIQSKFINHRLYAKSVLQLTTNSYRLSYNSSLSSFYFLHFLNASNQAIYHLIVVFTTHETFRGRKRASHIASI